MKQLNNVTIVPYSFAVEYDSDLKECNYRHKEYNRLTDVYKYWLPQEVITWLDSLSVLTQIFNIEHVNFKGYTIYTVHLIA